MTRQTRTPRKPVNSRAGFAAFFLLLVLPALFLCVLLVLAIDRGRLATSELRNAGVAAALAAAGEMAQDELLTNDPNRIKPVLSAAENWARQVAASNVAGKKPVPLAHDDLVFGATDQSFGGTFTPLDLDSPAADWKRLNAVEVTARLATNRSKLTRIRAMFDTAVTGFRPTPERPIPMVPFALYDGQDEPNSPLGWSAALAVVPHTDGFRYDPSQGVVDGRDALREVEVTIGAVKPGAVPAAVLSLGVVSHEAILGQVGNGIRTDDLTGGMFGGELSLLPAMTKPVLGGGNILNGHLAEVARAFGKVIGEKRVWPLFANAGEHGPILNGFTAARLMRVRYGTGDTCVRLTLQEAVLATPTAVTRPALSETGPNPPVQRSVGKVRLAG